MTIWIPIRRLLEVRNKGRPPLALGAPPALKVSFSSPTNDEAQFEQTVEVQVPLMVK